MSLIPLFPLYLFGNLHCLGMCGPLVMLLSQNRFRWLYFVGRFLSFTLVSLLAAEAGVTLNFLFKSSLVAPTLSLSMGAVIALFGLMTLLHFAYPGHAWLAKKSAALSHKIALLVNQEKPWPTFAFGLLTVALPCGQTIVIFSISALSQDPLFGFLNGALFALLTTPSLFFAVSAIKLLRKAKSHYSLIMGSLQIFVGALALLRGLADLDVIDHLILNPNSAPHYHIVFF